MNRQQIYDKVLFGIRAQGGPSVQRSKWEETSEPVLCRYRDGNGRMCAAGQLIDNKHYLPSFEGYVVTHKPVADALRRSGVGSQDMGLVSALQAAHDGDLAHKGFAQWEERMRDLADGFGLTYTPPEGEQA